MVDIFKKLFMKKKKDDTVPSMPIQTSPLCLDLLTSSSFSEEKIRPAQLMIGSGQSTGMQRDHNEDTLFTLSSVVADGVQDLSFGIGIIADGMGGHKHGAVASGVAARSIANRLVKKVFTHFLEIQPHPLGDSLQEILEKAISQTHKEVMEQAPGGGTTFTCAMIIGDQLTIGHVGDSRAYFIFDDGRIQQITKDHSLVQRMVDLEEIREEEAATHPQRNILLKALGQTEGVFPDVSTLPLPKNGYVLLCSDGLWGVVSNSEIAEIVRSGSEPVSICDLLIKSANTHGGPDNISVILFKCFN